jgi:tetratricopeptide (TPR) repeat protein
MRSAKLFILLFLGCTVNVSAASPWQIDSANAAYSRNEFEKAASLYEEILKDKLEAPEVYYNLGNAYYKQGKIGPAIVNYEKAKKLAPDDEDILSNLKYANQKVEDKIEPAPRFFLIEWKNDIVNMASEKTWSLICISMLSISLLLFGLYVIAANPLVRKLFFYTGAVLILSSVATFFIAKHRYALEIESREAIVLAGSVTVMGSPSEKGTKLFVLHEGTKINILEVSGDWAEIRIANGNTGWLKLEMLGTI